MTCQGQLAVYWSGASTDLWSPVSQLHSLRSWKLLALVSLVFPAPASAAGFSRIPRPGPQPGNSQNSRDSGGNPSLSHPPSLVPLHLQLLSHSLCPIFLSGCVRWGHKPCSCLLFRLSWRQAYMGGFGCLKNYYLGIQFNLNL